jgi:hypothetical protein
MKTSHNLNHVMYAMHADVLLINCWTELLLGYCWVTAMLLLCYCMLILYTTCSMLFDWLVNIVLLYHANKSDLSKHFNISSKTYYTLYYILKLSLIYWIYSKVLKTRKTDIFNVQLVQIYKTYIFCNFIIYKNNNFSVNKISPGCIGLLTRTRYWRTPRSFQSGHYPANIGIVRLRYELLTLWRLNYPRAHTSLYPLLKLVRCLNYY